MIRLSYFYGNGNKESLEYSSLTSFVFSLDIKHSSSNSKLSKITRVEVSYCPKLDLDSLICILETYKIPFQFISDGTEFDKMITKIVDYERLYNFTYMVTDGQVNLQKSN